MSRIVFIIHNGCLVHYNITKRKNGNFAAHLIKYSGRTAKEPATDIILKKEGRHWVGTEPDQDLLDNIGNAIES